MRLPAALRARVADYKANTLWVWRFFEPRAVHDGLPTRGLFCLRGCGMPALHVGMAQSASWDPFYFVDRTVMELFLAAICLVYINNGLAASGIVLFFFLVLRARVRVQGQAVIAAQFRTFVEKAKEDGLELSEAEAAVADATNSGGSSKHISAWKRAALSRQVSSKGGAMAMAARLAVSQHERQQQLERAGAEEGYTSGGSAEFAEAEKSRPPPVATIKSAGRAASARMSAPGITPKGVRINESQTPH